ncbi:MULTISPECIES: CPBP family intramembrane glutamic endopeptidase [unclassified Brevibacterium]|uniref:CPBP family intramembrane glutamic endopeptidase n=1 Tax=unclassified Brevibacterium TaxID=2614124 RepID=UPI0014855AFF|nr:MULTISPECIES: CPBP family intramembrane glutamic endopeptidase [unclassified Brevibacterium]MCM1011184.1 CPBP family intramembrane metalloprotease [Brevibacterium sp. XM4083]
MSPRIPTAYLRLLRDLPGNRWFKPALLVGLAALYYLVFLVGLLTVVAVWLGLSADDVDTAVAGIDDLNTVTGLLTMLLSVILMWPTLELAMLTVYQRWFFPLISVRRSGGAAGSGVNAEAAAATDPAGAEADPDGLRADAAADPAGTGFDGRGDGADGSWAQQTRARPNSVPGGMRWRLLGRYLLLSLVVWAVGLVVLGIIAPETVAIEHGVAWGHQLALQLVLVLLLVPLQAMSEELVFRGLAMTVIGSWMRHPAWALLLPIPLFVAGHIYDVPGLISVGIFAVVMGVLTLKTNGLEAAIAFHTVNNLFAFGFGIIAGTDLNATDTPPAVLAVGTAAPIVFALVVILDARRRGPELRVPRTAGTVGAIGPGATVARRPVRAHRDLGPGTPSGVPAPGLPSHREAHPREVPPPRGDLGRDVVEDSLGGWI